MSDRILVGIAVDDTTDNGKVPIYNNTTHAFDMGTGGGGNTIYTGDDTITGNRDVNLGIHTLTFNSIAYPDGLIYADNDGQVRLGDYGGDLNSNYLTINDGTGAVNLNASVTLQLQSFNTTDNGNYSWVNFSTTDVDATFDLFTSFNDQTYMAGITGFADSTHSFVNYDAGYHTFNGSTYTFTTALVSNAFKVKNGTTDYLIIDTTINSENFNLQAYNVTGSGSWGGINATTTDTFVNFSAECGFNNDKIAQIIGFADTTTSTLTATAEKITLTSSTINMGGLPTSSAGLSAGDLWVDTTGGLNILKMA